MQASEKLSHKCFIYAATIAVICWELKDVALPIVQAIINRFEENAKNQKVFEAESILILILCLQKVKVLSMDHL